MVRLQSTKSWDDFSGNNHHCAVCHTPLHHPCALKTCVGKHMVPCWRFHYSLQLPTSPQRCQYCTGADERHELRHRKIAELAKPLRNNNNSGHDALQDNTFSVGDVTPGETPLRGNAETPNRQRPSGNMRKKDRKELKRMTKAAARTCHITSEEVHLVWRIFHPDYDRDKPLDKQRAVVFHKHIEKLTDGYQNLSEIPMPDFTSDVRRIVEELGVRGASANMNSDNVSELKVLVTEDLKQFHLETLGIAERRREFLEWANRGALVRILNLFEDRDWKTGTKVELCYTDEDDEDTANEPEPQETPFRNGFKGRSGKHHRVTRPCNHPALGPGDDLDEDDIEQMQNTDHAKANDGEDSQPRNSSEYEDGYDNKTNTMSLDLGSSLEAYSDVRGQSLLSPPDKGKGKGKGAALPTASHIDSNDCHETLQEASIELVKHESPVHTDRKSQCESTLDFGRLQANSISITASRYADDDQMENDLLERKAKINKAMKELMAGKPHNNAGSMHQSNPLDHTNPHKSDATTSAISDPIGDTSSDAASSRSRSTSHTSTVASQIENTAAVTTGLGNKDRPTPLSKNLITGANSSHCCHHAHVFHPSPRPMYKHQRDSECPCCDPRCDNKGDLVWLSVPENGITAGPMPRRHAHILLKKGYVPAISFDRPGVGYYEANYDSAYIFELWEFQDLVMKLDSCHSHYGPFPSSLIDEALDGQEFECGKTPIYIPVHIYDWISTAKMDKLQLPMPLSIEPFWATFKSIGGTFGEFEYWVSHNIEMSLHTVNCRDCCDLDPRTAFIELLSMLDWDTLTPCQCPEEHKCGICGVCGRSDKKGEVLWECQMKGCKGLPFFHFKCVPSIAGILEEMTLLNPDQVDKKELLYREDHLPWERFGTDREKKWKMYCPTCLLVMSQRAGSI